MRSLIYVDFVFPSQHYSAVNDVSYGQGIAQTWAFMTTQPGGLNWPVVAAFPLILPYLFVAGLPVLLILFGLWYRWSAISPEITLLLLCGPAIWLSEFHRRDIHHLTYGSPLLTVLCFHMLTVHSNRLAQMAIKMFAICAACLAAFICSIAAITPSVSTRVGPVAILGQDALPVLRFLESHAQPGEDVLIYPYSPVYYFLSSTTNPTPYSFLLTNYNTPSQFQEVVQALELRKVRYVIWDTDQLAKLASSFRLNPQHDHQDQLIVENYLTSHYTTVQNEHGILALGAKALVSS